MNGANSPAFPRDFRGALAEYHAVHHGLTKREWFAGLAMQAWIDHNADAAGAAKHAVAAADALIRELEKTP